jgi:hypothetical protein
MYSILGKVRLAPQFVQSTRLLAVDDASQSGMRLSKMLHIVTDSSAGSRST